MQTHHLFFSGMPSWPMRLLVVVGLFAVALPRASGTASAGRWLALIVAGQTIACCCFELLAIFEPTGEGPWGAEVRRRPSLVLLQLLLTLLVSFMLHRADAGCRRVLRDLEGALRRLPLPVWRELYQLFTYAVPEAREPLVPASSSPTRTSPRLLVLSRAVARRGPPSPLPLSA
ncbi:hypothetical protein ACFV2L_38530 [Streptomyces sp. NPDC059687]|uniref:hypothetical protein n=1 Tax=Streptomyces sp. NPDC059687 TaxID=3346905 RepID=UPI00368A3220